MAVTASIRPSWTQKLATRMSGQAPGRIGSSAGVLGSKGIPTSQRGRFAKFGGAYGEEAGAQAALMTTHQAAQAGKAGVFAKTEQDNLFDADAYEQQERARRGLGGTQTATAPLRKPIPTTGAQAPENFQPVMDATNKAIEAQRTARRPTYMSSRAGVGVSGPTMPKPLDPTRINMTNQYQQGFTTRKPMKVAPMRAQNPLMSRIA